MSPAVITEIPRTHNPYPRHGVQADQNGIPRYTGLPGSLADFKIPQYVVVAGAPLPRNPSTSGRCAG